MIVYFPCPCGLNFHRAKIGWRCTGLDRRTSKAITVAETGRHSTGYVLWLVPSAYGVTGIRDPTYRYGARLRFPRRRCRSSGTPGRWPSNYAACCGGQDKTTGSLKGEGGELPVKQPSLTSDFGSSLVRSGAAWN